MAASFNNIFLFAFHRYKWLHQRPITNMFTSIVLFYVDARISDKIDIYDALGITTNLPSIKVFVFNSSDLFIWSPKLSSYYENPYNLYNILRYIDAAMLILVLPLQRLGHNFEYDFLCLSRRSMSYWHDISGIGHGYISAPLVLWRVINDQDISSRPCLILR